MSLSPRPMAASIIPVNVARLFGAADMSMNVAIRAGDILFFPSKEQASGGQVYVLGEVAQPTILPLPLDHDMTLARLILTSSQSSEFSNLKSVKIKRVAPDGSKQVLEVNVERILKTGDFEDDVKLQPEDVIIVPQKIFNVL